MEVVNLFSKCSWNALNKENQNWNLQCIQKQAHWNEEKCVLCLKNTNKKPCFKEYFFCPGALYSYLSLFSFWTWGEADLLPKKHHRLSGGSCVALLGGLGVSDGAGHPSIFKGLGVIAVSSRKSSPWFWECFFPSLSNTDIFCFLVKGLAVDCCAQCTCGGKSRNYSDSESEVS